MNIIFFGSSEFAVPSLKALLSCGHKISCVVTQPDRQKGRGLHLSPTAVKQTAGESNLNVYQVFNINTDESNEFLKDFHPDLFVVIAFGQILSEKILEIPAIFSINAHASLLPRYRGAAPINWSLINGEKKSGVSIIKMTGKMDAGPVILQKTIDIDEDDTAITLASRLSILASELLIESLKMVQNSTYKLTPQDETNVSFAPKLKKEDGLIKWDNSAQDIYNLIRGCLGWPGAYTYYKDKLLKVFKAKVSRTSQYPIKAEPGKIIEISKDVITVATGKDALIIQELQIEGKRIMKAAEFIAGHKVKAEEIFSK